MSQITIKVADEHELERWDAFVDRSPDGTLFHKVAWLKAAAEESGSSLVPLVGYRGEKMVVLFPCFFKKLWGLKLLFSPPPRCLIPHLGLLFNPLSPKRDALDRLYFDVVDAWDTFIQDRFEPDLITVANPVGIDDVRPFLWRDYQVKPMYTYVIPLEENHEDIFGKFSSDSRRLIKKTAGNPDLAVFSGDCSTYKELIEVVRARYAEQGLSLEVSDAYMQRIHDAFGEAHIRVKAIRNSGELAAGIVCLKDRDTIRLWMAGLTPAGRTGGLLELLHWEVVKEAAGNGCRHYDLVGANTRHLCHSKSRYDPQLAVYYQLQKATRKGRLFRSCYSLYTQWKQKTRHSSKVEDHDKK